MQLFKRAPHHPPVPPALVAAAIDFVLIERPAQERVGIAVNELAVTLGYSADTAVSLSLRMNASILMIADPKWAVIAALRNSLDLHDSLVFVHTTQRFIATAPIAPDGGFAIEALARSLTLLLPARGRA